jgi:hypothetical protein
MKAFWTPRKQLIVEANYRLRHSDHPNSRTAAYECIEGAVNQWMQNGCNKSAVAYFNGITDRAAKRLITEVMKGVR